MIRHLPLLALLAGWCLVTWGVAALWAWQAWPISGGLLLVGYGAVAVWAQVRDQQAQAAQQGPRRVA